MQMFERIQPAELYLGDIHGAELIERRAWGEMDVFITSILLTFTRYFDIDAAQ